MPPRPGYPPTDELAGGVRPGRPTGLGSVPRTLCRALAVPGHARGPRPRPAGPGPGPGQQRPAPPRGPGPRAPPIRAALGRTPTRRDRDRPRPLARAANPPGRVTHRGKDIRGTRRKDIRGTSRLPGIRDKTSQARHRAGRAVEGFPPAQEWPRQGPQGPGPGGPGPFAAEQPWAGQYGPGWAGACAGTSPGAGQPPGAWASMATARSAGIRAAGSWARARLRPRPVRRRATSRPARAGTRTGARAWAYAGQAPTVKGSLARDRTRQIPTVPASTAVPRCRGTSVSTHGTRDPGRPPGRSKHLAGHLDRHRSRDRTSGQPGRGEAACWGLPRDHTAPATATPAAGRRRPPAMALTHGPGSSCPTQCRAPPTGWRSARARGLSTAIGPDRASAPVFVAVALNEVPIDVLALQLGSNRNAIYQDLFDARRNLRATSPRPAIRAVGGCRPR